jgi:hypothetical protein
MGLHFWQYNPGTVGSSWGGLAGTERLPGSSWGVSLAKIYFSTSLGPSSGPMRPTLDCDLTLPAAHCCCCCCCCCCPLLLLLLLLCTQVKVLSGGEKARLALAKFMCTQVGAGRLLWRIGVPAGRGGRISWGHAQGLQRRQPC